MILQEKYNIGVKDNELVECNVEVKTDCIILCGMAKKLTPLSHAKTTITLWSH
jgi:hypothetical protein